MKTSLLKFGMPLACLTLLISPAFAQTESEVLDLMSHWGAVTSLVIFIFAYALVISEETIHLRKSKPAMSRAVVRLSAIGDMTNDRAPVTQNS